MIGKDLVKRFLDLSWPLHLAAVEVENGRVISKQRGITGRIAVIPTFEETVIEGGDLGVHRLSNS